MIFHARPVRPEPVDGGSGARRAQATITAMASVGGHRELGLVTRAEARAAGLTDRALAWRVESGRWQRLHSGVYLNRPGPIGWLTHASATVLACGPGAVLVDDSAAFLHQLVQSPGPVVCLAVPAARRVISPQGARVRRARAVESSGSRWPPRTGVEATVVDLAVTSSPDDLTALIGRCIQAGLTSADRLLRELSRRGRHRQRALVVEILADVRGGCESALEVRFLRDVLRRHGLPPGEGQYPLSAIDPELGGRRADRAFVSERVLVELDGARFHQGAVLARDRFKSNRVSAFGWIVVRYGWPETVDQPCRTAVEFALLLRARGWRGSARACSAGCPVATLRSPRPA
jgi:hypothetical protein